MNFDQTPLITPETSQKDWQSIFDSLPKWVGTPGYEPFEPNNLADPEQEYPVTIAVGKKHRKPITITLLQFAFLLEVNRLGHTVVTNINKKANNPNQKVYAKQRFRDAGKDYMPLARIFVDAGPNEAVKTLAIESDLRIENLFVIGAGKPSKHSLDVTLKHVERLALKRKTAGTLPEGFSVKAYIDNIKTLHDAFHNEWLASSGL